MLTSKQRAKLRSMANGFDVLYQVGKGGIADTIVAQTEDALEARELIKLSVLENSPYTAREAAEELAERTGADVVVFGHSHKYEEREENGVLWLNPGSCGRRRFHQEITLCRMEAEDGQFRVEKCLIPHEGA